jgi:hypothetical protein
MATESKSTPRVLNRGTDALGETKVIRDIEVESETFTTTLSNGRQVVLREMMAGDLLYLEKSLGNLGDTERSLKLIVRLSTSEGRVTYEDLQKLKMKDLKKVTDLLTQASGVDEDDEDEFPNE